MLGGSTRAMDGPHNATAQDLTILMRDIGHVNTSDFYRVECGKDRVQQLLGRMDSAEKKKCERRAAKAIAKFKKLGIPTHGNND